MKFYASVRLDLARTKTVKIESENGETKEGESNLVSIKCIKNKMAPPFKEIILSLDFNIGFDKLDNLIDVGVQKGIISKSGSWYSYHKEQIGQGIKEAKEFLKGKEVEFIKELNASSI